MKRLPYITRCQRLERRIEKTFSTFYVNGTRKQRMFNIANPWVIHPYNTEGSCSHTTAPKRAPSGEEYSSPLGPDVGARQEQTAGPFTDVVRSMNALVKCADHQSPGIVTRVTMADFTAIVDAAHNTFPYSADQPLVPRLNPPPVSYAQSVGVMPPVARSKLAKVPKGKGTQSAAIRPSDTKGTSRLERVRRSRRPLQYPNRHP